MIRKSSANATAFSSTATWEMPIACIAGKNSAIVEKFVSIRPAPMTKA